jgi:formylglycine-generating enzyme required for sulfatase activity
MSLFTRITGLSALLIFSSACTALVGEFEKVEDTGTDNDSATASDTESGSEVSSDSNGDSASDTTDTTSDSDSTVDTNDTASDTSDTVSDTTDTASDSGSDTDTTDSASDSETLTDSVDTASDSDSQTDSDTVPDLCDTGEHPECYADAIWCVNDSDEPLELVEECILPEYCIEEPAGVFSCDCAPNTSSACYGGDVWWYDSCGNLDVRMDDCTACESCIATSGTSAECRATVALSKKQCVDGDVTWFDSCNVQGAVFQTCQACETCSNLGALDAQCSATTVLDHRECGADGNVHWVDSCGVEGAVVDICAACENCQVDTCVVDVEQDHPACGIDGNVHWIDSCGTEGEIIDSCAPCENCQIDTCVVDEVQNHQQCGMDGSIHWVDSCGGEGALAEACDPCETCTNTTSTTASCGPPSLQAYQRCGTDGNVHWFDSCGVEGVLVDSCEACETCNNTGGTTAQCDVTSIQDHQQCGMDGNVHWVDSCGVEGAIVDTCAACETCSVDTCVVDAVQDRQQCGVDGNVHWVDSCGVEGAIVDTCATCETCANIDGDSAQCDVTTVQAYQQCGLDGNVLWFDSCGVEGSIVSTCSDCSPCLNTSGTTAICEPLDDFTECNTVTAPFDRDYDICISGTCQSPGCGTADCNAPGPHFELPDTNQRSCTNGSVEIPCPATGTSYHGQDAQYGWDTFHASSERFTRNTAAVNHPLVVDNVTGLTWQGCAVGLQGSDCSADDPTVPGTGALGYSWSAALNHCETLSWGGHTDWRLPDEFELASIVNAGTRNPAIDTTAFPATPASSFWTSSTSADLVSDAWRVDFLDGAVNDPGKSNQYFVRCIRSGAPLDRTKSSITATGNPIIIDNATGLRWQGCSAGQNGAACDTGTATNYGWSGALNFCETLTWGGFTDWRLPDRFELQSLVNNHRINPAIDTTAFPVIANTFFWSSTTYAGFPEYAWGAYFSNGNSAGQLKAEGKNVRCVRGNAAEGQACTSDGDCTSGACHAGTGKCVAASCTGRMDFTPCELDTTVAEGVDRSYDICVSGTCVSPGCGNTSCNVPGPHFPLSDSSQRKCYNNTIEIPCPLTGEVFYGQDAQYGWDTTHVVAERFTKNTSAANAPVVHDNVTDLDWQGCINVRTGDSCNGGTNSTMTQTAALAHCDGLTWGGYTDWRLPDEYELYSLVDYSRNTPALDTAVFSNTVGSWYWSSSASARPGYPDEGWAVFFAGGGTTSLQGTYAPRATSYYVRCVRGGGTAPSNRFEVSMNASDRLIVDNTTDLMWQGCAAGQTGATCTGTHTQYLWRDALNYCEGSTWGGYTDWRLPDSHEQQSISDNRRWGPAFNPAFIAFPPTGGYWSATTDEKTPAYAWAQWWGHALLSRYDKTVATNMYARCVRGGLHNQPISTGWKTVTAGSFWMGSPDGSCPMDYPGGTTCPTEPGRWTDEDLHYVTLTNNFELMVTETTQSDFSRTMGWNPSLLTSCGANCPVENVSWYDALAFANRLSVNAGYTPCYTFSSVVCEDTTAAGTDYMACQNAVRGGIDTATITLNGVSSPYACTGYRLPTESEWEYAVRAGSLTALYPSDGNDGSLTNTGATPLDPNMSQIAWYSGNSSSSAHPVSTKEANSNGFFDMSGNVMEWTWDWYENAYPISDTFIPLVDPVGGLPGEYHSTRGGSWLHDAGAARSAGRGGGKPDIRMYMIGFRLARTIP